MHGFGRAPARRASMSCEGELKTYVLLLAPHLFALASGQSGQHFAQLLAPIIRVGRLPPLPRTRPPVLITSAPISFASSDRLPYQHLREDVGLQIVICGVQVSNGEFDRRDFRLITGDARGRIEHFAVLHVVRITANLLDRGVLSRSAAAPPMRSRFAHDALPWARPCS
jgi:hypothetical protein